MPQDSMSADVIAGLILLFVAIVGFAFWWYRVRPEEEPPEPRPLPTLRADIRCGDCNRVIPAGDPFMYSPSYDAVHPYDCLLDPEPVCLIHDFSGEDVPGWEMAECTCNHIYKRDRNRNRNDKESR